MFYAVRAKKNNTPVCLFGNDRSKSDSEGFSDYDDDIIVSDGKLVKMKMVHINLIDMNDRNMKFT